MNRSTAPRRPGRDATRHEPPIADAGGLLRAPQQDGAALGEAVVAAGGAPRLGALASVTSAVEGLGFEMVDLERLPRGLLRISIDRIPGHVYPIESEFVTVEDCELVTRQLQLVLEVEQIDYARLEVSSPGLDRPLRKPADWVRFCGLDIDVTFRMPFQGRRKFRGRLVQAEPTPRLVITEGKTEQALDFTLDEVREARLVPVVDFKGRAKGARNGEQQP